MPEETVRFEKAGDGEHWRMRTEGGDVEGHIAKSGRFEMEPGEGDDAEGHAARKGFLSAHPVEEDTEGHKYRRFTAEPAGEEDGQPLFKLDFGDDDTEGHRAYSSSDLRLKRRVRDL